jgi:hypothetical protein
MCSLFFIDQYVLACVPLSKIWPGFLSIHSGDKQWKAIHRDVASISKAIVLVPACKQQACAVRGYDSTYSRDQKSLLTYKAFVRNIPQSELLLTVFQKDQKCPCICTDTWVALSNICVTTVNMRSGFVRKYMNMFIVHSSYIYVWLTLCKWCVQQKINV